MTQEGRVLRIGFWETNPEFISRILKSSYGEVQTATPELRFSTNTLDSREIEAPILNNLPKIDNILPSTSNSPPGKILLIIIEIKIHLQTGTLILKEEDRFCLLPSIFRKAIVFFPSERKSSIPQPQP